MTSTEIADRPQQSDYKPISQIQTIDEALKHPGIISRFKEAVPKHLGVERMLRVCSMAVFRTPALKNCEMMSLLGAMLSLASLGLEPNTPLGHAYLIPFAKKTKKTGPQGGVLWEETFNVEVVIGYRGLIDLARRSGSLVSIHADVVYDGDVFEFEYGSAMHLKHIPMGKRSTPLWAYAHASLKDGQAFEVMPYSLVQSIRNNSQGYRAALAAKKEADENPTGKGWKRKTWESSPWVAYEHEMAAKTAIRRVAKVLPMSIEFMRAVEFDELSETGRMSFETIMAQPHALENFSLADDSEPDPDDSGPTGSGSAPPTTQGTEPTSTSSSASSAPTETAASAEAPKRRGRPPKAQQTGDQAPSEPQESRAEEHAERDEPSATEGSAQNSEPLGDWELITNDGEVVYCRTAQEFANQFSMKTSKLEQANEAALVNGLYESNEFMLKRLQAEAPNLALVVTRVNSEGPKSVQDPLDIPPFLDRRPQAKPAAPGKFI